MKSKKRVLLGMSGGTDSSVAAMLLQEAGYEVTGVTFRFYDSEGFEESLDDARNLASRLNIPHIIYDARELFRERIIRYFVYKMVKSLSSYTSYIHSRSFSYSLKSLQNLDLICIIFCAHEVPPLVFALYRSFNNLKNLVHPEFAVYKLIQPCTGDQGLDVGNF